ncbi:UNVERIFIED_CONTAM: hypothetical protein GTU68_065539 [Idotea baltica]|nr:hypothetical protein [Idotea baltica]
MGLIEITHDLNQIISNSNIEHGLCNIFIKHTSASLIIQENADPSAKHDLEQWLNRLVVEDDPLYTHTFEGSDDMPAHIKSILTSTSLNIPIINNSLQLGTWQGVYLWEHRRKSHNRTIVVSTLN